MASRKACIMLLLSLSLFGGIAYGQTPDSAAVTTPVATPVTTSAATPAAAPAATPAAPQAATRAATRPATRAATRAATPADTPAAAPADTPAAAPVVTPADTPAETPVAAPADTPADTPVATPTATQSAQPSTQAAPQSEVSGIPDYPVLRTLGGLGLVISLIVLGFFAARKYAPQYFNRKSGEQKLKILESLSMGDKRTIVLVQVEGACYLVGNTAHQINLLAQLPPDFAQSSANSGADAGDSFRKLYEVEKKTSAPRGVPKALPADVRAKMRQLREALEH